MTVSATGVQYDGHHPFFTDERILDILREISGKEYRRNGVVLKPAGEFPWEHRDYIFEQEGYPHLAARIYNNHGRRGFEYFARKLDKPVKRIRQSRAGLKDPGNLRRAYLRLTRYAMYDRETGKMIKPPHIGPSAEHLRRGSTYATAVYRALRDLGNGSLNRARRKLRLKQRTTRGGKWKDWGSWAYQFLELADNPLYDKTGKKIKEPGVEPSGTQLIASGHSGFYHAAFSHYGGYENAKRRARKLAVEDMPSFLKFVETNERAKDLVTVFYDQENPAELALGRALAAAFPRHFVKKPDFLDAEQLRSYQRGQSTLEDIARVAYLGANDEALRDVIVNMARDKTFNSLGEHPTEEQIAERYNFVVESERQATDPHFRRLFTAIKQEFDAFNRMRSKFYSYMNAAKGQDPAFQPHELKFGQLYGAFSSYWRGRMLHSDVAGFGKTAQEIAAKIMHDIADGKMPEIVFGPNSAKPVWEREVRHDYPRPNILVVNSYDDATLAAMGGQDFVFLNYDSLSSPHTREKIARKLREMRRVRIVLDESQLLKGSRTTRFRLVKPMLDRTASVDLVSFTPFDSLPDAYVTVSVLEPEKYPTPEDARKAFIADPLVFHTVLSRHMTRRGVEDLPDVPRYPVELSPQELEAYSRILAVDFDKGQLKLDQLRKAVINPALLDREFLDDETLWRALQTTTPAKFLAIDRILEGMEPDAKAVIFSSYLRRGVMEELQRRYAGLGALRIDGTVPYGYRNRSNQREEIRQWWLNNKANRILIVNEAAAESLSLAYYGGRTHSINLDMPPSSITFVQYVTRETRSGNTNVVYYNLAAEYPYHPLGSVDDGLTELVQKKLEGNRILLGGGRLTEDGRHVLSGVPLYRQKPVAARLWTPEQQEARRMEKAA